MDKDEKKPKKGEKGREELGMVSEMECLGEDVDMGEELCHIHTYESSWTTYALGYSWRYDQPFRFGIGSFLEGKENKVLYAQAV